LRSQENFIQTVKSWINLYTEYFFTLLLEVPIRSNTVEQLNPIIGTNYWDEKTYRSERETFVQKISLRKKTS
jgi:hypothetical protein